MCIPRSLRAIVVSFVVMFVPSAPSCAWAVLYEVTFDATWSAATHPDAYPAGAHFSPLVGVTHNDQVSFWEPGGTASPGIELMAELGATNTLQSEFSAAGANADTVILGRLIFSPGSTSAMFNVEPTHPLVTLVTMVAPSPDWFVGVSGLNLHNGNSWIPEVIVPLVVYDAGTDSGPTFQSPNNDTNPQEPIALLGAPFVGANGAPLGTFTFRLQVPEPASFLLLHCGVGFALLLRRRRI